MKITRGNYETYFLDYLEGTLDPATMEEVRIFLNENPDLKTELDEFELVHLYAEPISFTEKEQLKKSPSSTVIFKDQKFDQLCVARIEGDLDPGQERALDDYLKDNPRRRRELDLFYKTRLQPSLILYPDKHLLKQKTTVFWRKYALYSISAAASIILIVVFSLTLKTIGIPETEQIVVIPGKIEDIEVSNPDEVLIDENVVASTPSEISEKSNPPDQNKNPAESTTGYIAEINLVSNTQKENPVAVIQAGTPDDRMSNMKPLARREVEQISFTPYETLTALKTASQETEVTKAYLTLRELMAQRLRSTDLPDEQAKPENTKLTFLDVADAGIRGISRLPGVDMQLNRNYDKEGELTSYAFTSRNLSFSHEVKK